VPGPSRELPGPATLRRRPRGVVGAGTDPATEPVTS
jgi:hypothetical protein